MFADLLHPELDSGKTIIDPTRFVADPDKARVFPELPYVTVRLGYVACGHFNADIGLGQSSAPSIGLSIARCFCRNRWASRNCFPA